MRAACRSWLPAGVVERSDLDRRIAETLAQWSAKWFVKRVGKPLAALQRDVPRAIHVADRPEVLTLGDDLALVMTPAARSTLALAMIGAPERTVAETAADRDLIDALSQTCLDDLCRRMATTVGVDDSEAWGKVENESLVGWSCDIGFGATAALLRLTVGEDAMIGSVRRAMAPAAGGPGLGSIGDALRRQEVDVSARIGGVAITLADFKNLGIGDVLILDRAASSAIDLAIDGHLHRAVPCIVTRGDDALGLTLQHSLDR